MKSSTTLRRRLIAFGAAGAMVAGSFALITSPAQAEGNILGTDHPDAIPGSYLVTMEGDFSTQAVSSYADNYEADITSEWSSFNGFAAKMSEAEAKKLAADPGVKSVEQDAEVHIADAGEQPNPPAWGIDRVDQRDLPLDDLYAYPNQGTDVTAYILDTGVYLTHNEFEGRMVEGFDAVSPGGDANDCHGHGTHVAGSTAGTLTGVAKNASISPVRVLDCNGSGSFEGIIDGVDWVAQNATGDAVANMSLGGGFNDTLNQAVASAVSSGVTFVVASGNDNASACNYSPASEESAITVNSSTNTDARSSFSNFGECSDIFAPGSDIYGPWIGGDDEFSTISGTSMASPHVAGAAALYLAANPGASPSEVKGELVDNATEGAISNPGTDTPNRLLYVGFIGGGDPGDPDSDFDVSMSPSSGEVEPGDSVSATLSTETLEGDPQEVTLSHTGGGDDVTVEFESDSVTTGESTEVTFGTSAGTAEGTYELSVTATGTEAERSADFALTVGEVDDPPPGDCEGTNSQPQPIPSDWFIASDIVLDCVDSEGTTATVTIDVDTASAENMEFLVMDSNNQMHIVKAAGESDSGTYTIDVGANAGNGYYSLYIFNFGGASTLNSWSVEV